MSKLLDGVRHWGTTPAERQAVFPDDPPDDRADPQPDPQPDDQAHKPGPDLLWRGVDVMAPAGVVFRWLCQLRVAPYSYDWIDNGGRRSPRQLDPQLQQLACGQTFMQIFALEAFAQGVHVTLATPAGSRGARLFGVVRVTYWAKPVTADRTRLLAKLRVVPAPGLRGAAMRIFLPWGDLVMMRRQLLNLKALAEACPGTNAGQDGLDL